MLTSFQWRNLYGILALCIGISLVLFFSPEAIKKEAAIFCHDSKTALAVLPNMESCLVKMNQVPEWKYCSCIRPENVWSKIYWLISVPSIIAFACWLFLRITPKNLGSQIKGILLASTIYSVMAVLAFAIFYSPFAGVHQLLGALVYIVFVLLPYAVLYVAHRISTDRKSEIVVMFLSIIATVIGGFLYSGSFNYNDGEYYVAYMVTPIIQAPFALGVMIYVTGRRRKKLATQDQL